jgi:hypothetical protein
MKGKDDDLGDRYNDVNIWNWCCCKTRTRAAAQLGADLGNETITLIITASRAIDLCG